ncbi:unnamed protein product [Mytilus edulis]|uniref:Uncharacterized protein n=1 Tax=Mytilus edulis TaxID=6550 RepID=A0A8S3U0Y6_MYTED|nr:unnamed protein product [Mytilus edulis]
MNSAFLGESDDDSVPWDTDRMAGRIPHTHVSLNLKPALRDKRYRSQAYGYEKEYTGNIKAEWYPPSQNSNTGYQQQGYGGPSQPEANLDESQGFSPAPYHQDGGDQTSWRPGETPRSRYENINKGGPAKDQDDPGIGIIYGPFPHLNEAPPSNHYEVGQMNTQVSSRTTTPYRVGPQPMRARVQYSGTPYEEGSVQVRLNTAPHSEQNGRRQDYRYVIDHNQTQPNATQNQDPPRSEWTDTQSGLESPVQRWVTVDQDDDPTRTVGPAVGTSKADSNSNKQGPRIQRNDKGELETG